MTQIRERVDITLSSIAWVGACFAVQKYKSAHSFPKEQSKHTCQLKYYRHSTDVK